jgi:HK97 family phage prohead protease
MNEKREIRTIECQLSIREAAPNAMGESRTIAGTAIVFNRESQELDDWGEKFKEIILPEAVTMSFLDTQDVKLNLLHDRKMTIARCNKGAANSSLRLSVDENGVNFEFDAPRCDLGDRALELVRTGVYSGCSFEFKPKDYEKIVDGDTVTIIHHSFEYLNALTLGMDPAYRQTSVNVREVKGEKPEDSEEDKEKRGCGGDTEDRGCGDGNDDEKRGKDKEGDKPLESDNPDDLEEMEEKERERRVRAAYNRRNREIMMFRIENNY